MLLLTREDIRTAAPMALAMDAAADAFAQLSSGRADVPPRPQVAIPPQDGLALVMPAYLAGPAGVSGDDTLAVKLVTVFPHNPERHGLPTIAALVLLLDTATGIPLALMEGAWLTALRTGAASGVATRLLARPDARTLALFGAGAQALPQAWAVCEARAIERIRIVSRTPAHAERLAAELRAFGSPIPADVRAAPAREALAGADIICCATTSTTPVLDDADLAPGAHINGIGSFRPTMREVPAATVARARVIVDQRASAWAEAGDLIQPRAAGLIAEEHVIAELGELVLGRVPGRTDPTQITFFKSVGSAAQDAAVARLAYERARSLGLGTQITLEAPRSDRRSD